LNYILLNKRVVKITDIRRIDLEINNFEFEDDLLSLPLFKSESEVLWGPNILNKK